MRLLLWQHHGWWPHGCLPGKPMELSFGVGHRSSIESNLKTIDRNEYYITAKQIVDNKGNLVPYGVDLICTWGDDFDAYKHELKTNPHAKIKYMRFKHDPNLDSSSAVTRTAVACSLLALGSLACPSL